MNVLIQPISGSIYFDNNTAGSSTTSAGNATIAYNTSGGLTVFSSNTANTYRFGVSGSQGNLLSIYDTTTGQTVTITGGLSTTAAIIASGGNSNQWNVGYSYATGYNQTSGTFLTPTSIAPLSANWQSTFYTVCGLSAGWGSSSGTANLGQIPVLSSNWNSSYTTTQASSAAWYAEGLMPIPITTNSTVGGLTVGTVFTANTPLSTIIQRMIVAAISATYTYPTLSASTSAFAFEIGTNISPTISSIWTQNDAGSATSYTILSSFTFSTGYTPVTSITGLTTTYNISSLSSITLNSFYLLSTTYFEVSATYAQGPQKQDNYGNNSGTPIASGFITSSAFGISAYRVGFYSADTYTYTLSDSNSVRTLTGKAIVPSGFTVNVPAGTTRLVFVYPSNYALTITNPSLVNISPANGYNVNTSLFTTSSIQVSGANNFAPIGYRAFSYVGTPPTGNYSITTSQPTSSVSYTAPGLTNNITTTTPLCGEIGTLSAINFTSTYTNSDAGGITAYAVLTSWDNTTYTQITAVNTSQTSFAVTTPSVPLSSKSVNTNNTFYIQTSATYSTGPIKYNTYNDLNATGQIQAGSVTRTTSVALSAFRRMFYTFDTSTSTPNDSNSVRALTGVFNNPQANNTYTFTQAQIPAGLKRMVFAYPSYVGPITTAQDTTDNFSYLANLTLTTVSVSGANGLYPINYNVYTYIAGGTFGNFNFTLTI